MERFNCRGQACPGPVLQAKAALERLSPGDSFALEVDGEAARDNVRRFAEGRGAAVAVEGLAGGWRLTVTAAEPPATAAPAGRPPAVLLASDSLGHGDDKLGRLLMEGFVATLADQAAPPDRVLLMNGGVRLAVEGAPTAAALRALSDRGCEVLACGTCLDFFAVRERLAAGRASNMFEIQKALLEASSVVRP
jgi:selenium metabolism protein YedF